jgi:hypothetical protein
MSNRNTKVELTTESPAFAKPMLGEGLVKYYVRWRHIPSELYMTPLYLISIDHTVVEAKENASNYEIMKAVAADFTSMNISPDDVSIESVQPFA